MILTSGLVTGHQCNKIEPSFWRMITDPECHSFSSASLFIEHGDCSLECHPLLSEDYPQNQTFLWCETILNFNFHHQYWFGQFGDYWLLTQEFWPNMDIWSSARHLIWWDAPYTNVGLFVTVAPTFQFKMVLGRGCFCFCFIIGSEFDPHW